MGQEKIKKTFMLQYRKLDMSCLNLIHKIDLKKENIISFEVLMQKNWNSPDLLIHFKDSIFRHPIGLIVNYSQVIKYLKKNFN
jgi:hypothetical protein